MRILLLTARYLPHRGGLETVVRHLAHELQCAGDEVLIVTNRYPHTLSARDCVEGIPVRRLQFLYPCARYLARGRFDLFAAGLGYAVTTTQSLQRLVREFQPDVINLHYLGAPGYFLLRLGEQSRIPVVVSLHGGDVDGEPHRASSARRLFETVMEHAAVVTACSANLAEQALRLAPAAAGKMWVIHNGVDHERFATATPYRYSQPYVLAVGQLVPHKGFDLLIQAFSDIVPEHLSWHLLIAGEGRQRPELEAHIRARGMEDQIVLLGRVDEATVAGLMRGCRLVAMPSLREPFGIVALEGMAAGRPVLATPVGGIPEFLPPGINRLIPPERGAWAQALQEELARHASQPADGSANTEHARRFAWSGVAQRYRAAYIRVLESAGSFAN